MNLKLLSSVTTRRGTVATAVALCGPATQFQVISDAGASAPSALSSSRWSSSPWSDLFWS